MKNYILLPKNNLSMQEDYPAKKTFFKTEDNNKAFLVGKVV